MTSRQKTQIKKFILANDATVTAIHMHPRGNLTVTYSLPQAPGQESLSARYLPEWAEVTYGPLGIEKIFSSSWDERRKLRHIVQVAMTGTLTP
jgi:hypothetical protein